MSLNLTIDLADTTRLAQRLTEFSGTRLRESAARAANSAAERSMPLLRKRVGARVALAPAFVEQRTRILPASAQRNVQEAVLVAPARRASANALGLQNPFVSLRNYGPQQIAQAVKYPNSAITKLIGKWGPHPTKPGAFLKWKPRRGDALRGIAPDQKARGVSVRVTGPRKRIATAFLAPARAGKSGLQARGLGVFQRQANGKLKLLHGPAVYRLFRDAADRAVPELQAVLREETTAEVAALINEVFP